MNLDYLIYNKELLVVVYIKLQNYTNIMVVDEHGIQTFEVVLVVLLLLKL